MAGQRHGFLAFAEAGTKFLDVLVEFEQHAALLVAAHHALQPEKRTDPSPPGHGVDAVQAAGRIKNEVAGRQLHFVRAIGVDDLQLATLVTAGCPHAS